MASAALVAVRYRCPCTAYIDTAETQQQPAGHGAGESDHGSVAEPDHGSVAESDLGSVAVGPPKGTAPRALVALQTWPIEALYYCDDCSEVRCPRCVVEEPAGYHCPNCLFDVPTASVRSERNCCARNCFQCPVCTQMLSVIEEESSRDSGGRSCYVLSCAVCFWDSREIGWEFEKATGISAQIERIRAGEAKEYAGLLDYWRAVQRTASATPGSQRLGAGLSGTGSGSFGQRLVAAALPGGSTVACVDALPAYRAANHADAGRAQSSVASPARDANGGEPQQIRLHMKLSRRCRVCHHILIKPESKAQATRFKIQLMAVNFMPAITVPVGLAGPGGRWTELTTAQLAGPFGAGSPVPLVVRFANPLYTEMDVTVAAGEDESVHVNVLAPRFTLAPFAELWEYDEDEDADADGAENSGSDKHGVVHRHGNRVAIQLEITPRAPAASLVVPLYITCTHLDDMADMDAEDNGGNGGSSSKNSGSRLSRRLVTSSFWVHISLGSAQ